MAAASTLTFTGGLAPPHVWRRWRLLLAPLVAGAALLAVAALLSQADEVTHLAGWNSAALLIAGMAALAASLRGAREATTNVDRQVRLVLGGAAFFYAFGQMAHLVGRISGLRPSPIFDAIPIIGIMSIVAACWWIVLRKRYPHTEQFAITLDSAVVFCTAGAASLVLLGTQIDHAGGALALAYTAMFSSTLGATMVLNLAITPKRGASGWVAVVVGVLTMVIGSTWEALAGSFSWAPFTVVQGCGLLIAGFGCATWTAELDPSVRFRQMAARVRGWLPLAAVAVSSGLIVGSGILTTSRDEGIGLAADVLLAIVLLLCVVRQTMLLRERGRITSAAREASDRELALLEDLRISEQRFRSLVTNSSDVFLIISAEGSITYQSPAIERVLGYPAEDRLGHRIFELMHPEDQAFVQATLAEIVSTPAAQRTIELRARHADGSWRMLEATVRNMHGDPAVGGIVVNYRDVTERKTLEEQLTHQAFHDPLTGLANRALFSDRVNHAMRRRGDRTVSVLFMDLDDFKTINDSLGHVAGDVVLTHVSQRLRACLRPEDTVARLGGDEFAILLEEASFTDVGVIADRLLASLQQPFEAGSKQVHIGASMGVAFGTETSDADELLRNADVAMYTAKGRGKGRIEIFEASMHAAVVTRLELRADLEHALERGEFRLRYQPLYELATGELHSFEALLRWRHPVRGDVGPGEFIPLAEETGLIVPIGRWILEQTCRQAQAWREAGRPDLKASFNLSARQLRESRIVEWVADALAATKLPAANLIVELTESGIMQDDEGRLHELRGLGVQLALDDFGTGYSSLSYLSRFPIDILKIDRSFVSSLGSRHDESALIRSVVQLAASMKLKTVAEGIERPEQLERVKELGCDYGQGFLLAKPMDPIRATRLVSETAYGMTDMAVEASGA
jgi:diguanylate cyclase (GGDEF)-like protein/PAS domain S-box-containing protein